MSGWLMDQLFGAGNQAGPRFAFHGSVNWMRALSILTSNGDFGDQALSEFFASVKERAPNHELDAAVYESVFLAFGHLAGLFATTNQISNPYDACRAAIGAWHSCIHCSARSMVLAASTKFDGHRKPVVREWQTLLVDQGLIISPFSPSAGSLVGKECDAVILRLRGDNGFDVNSMPASAEQAWGAAVSYFSGTIDFEREKVEEEIVRLPEFVSLNVSNFRTRAARVVRDSALSGRIVNFLTQADRYRGKAEYRDSLFLSYGEDHSDLVERFLIDLRKVGEAFFRMACAYSARRVERGSWAEFVRDVELNSRLDLDSNVLRVV